MTRKQIALEVVTWILTVFIFVIFFRAGILKFSDSSFWAAAFRNMGFPVWFRIVIAVLETAGAVFLLWPRTASYAALNLAVVMVGAIGTVLTVGSTRNLVQPIAALVLLCIVAALRWRKRYRLPWSHSAISAPSSLS
jgi:uncharacterized membrane protein YphA (DoxX/SURF4 family)